MTGIQFTVIVEDLFVFNQYVLRKRFAYMLPGMFLVLQGIQLIGGLTSGDFSTFWYTSGVAIVLGLLLYSSMYNPGVTAIFTTALVVLVIGLFLFAVDESLSTKIAGIIAAMPILILGYFGIIFRRYYKYLYGSKNDSLGPRTLTMDNNGIREKSDLSEGSQAWAIIDRIEQDKQNIYIFIGRGKAHVIPKRSFNEPKDAEEFLAEAIRLKTASAK